MTSNDLSTAQSLDDINWDDWQAVNQATLLLTVKDNKILLMRKKRGLGRRKKSMVRGAKSIRVRLYWTVLSGRLRKSSASRLMTQRLSVKACSSLLMATPFMSIRLWRLILAVSQLKTDEAFPIWFSLDEIPYDEMWEDDKYWIPLALKGQQFTGRYLFDNDKMLDYKIQLTKERSI